MDQIESQANLVENHVFPTSNGIYQFSTDVLLSEITNLNDYEISAISTIILINGDFTIDRNINSIGNNHTIFIVKKNVLVDPNVTNINGFYIIEGIFDSDPNTISINQLLVNGSVIAIEGINFNRFVSDETPGEKFVWRSEYLLDQSLMTLLLGKKYNHTWQEISY